MKDESNKEGFTREDRLKAIKSILRENSKLKQSEIREKLEAQGFSTGQGTISKDLKALHYIKDPKRGYVKSEDKAFQELEAILSRVISYANPTFKIMYKKDKSIYVLYIYSKEGLEDTISELISIIYSERITATITGRECVAVHFSKNSLAKRMMGELKKYASMI